MEARGKKQYGNVTRPFIKAFLDCSEEYKTKTAKKVNHGLVVKAIRSGNLKKYYNSNIISYIITQTINIANIKDKFNNRWQIDLIDFRTLPDGDYHWILTVQDHFTKFVWLRPLTQKSGVCVARELYQLFCMFGAPYILQSDNGREFRNAIVEALKIMWPELEILHGRPRYPQSQGSVERANGDIQNILGSWSRRMGSSSWLVELVY